MTTRPMAIGWVLVLLGCTGLWSCKSSAPVTQRIGEIAGNEQVLILPFQNMAWLHGENVSVRSPLTGKVFMTGPATEDVEHLLTQMLVNAVHQHTAFQTVSSREAPAIRDALPPDGEIHKAPVKILARTGRMLKADFVLQGYVYRFKERVGRDFSAESPASIAFDLHLIDCVNETLAWSAYFDETQQALTDDLRYMGTFFKRGGRWITAQAMAKEAMNTMFKEFKQP